MIFSYTTVMHSGNSWVNTITALRDAGLSGIEEAGGRLYGIWIPLFGLRSNELVAMLAWPDDPPADVVEERSDGFFAGLEGVAESRTIAMAPTVRPTDHTPPARRGIYVHRWMTFQEADVDEAVSLSNAAWATFEATFDAEVIGLFRNLRGSEGLVSLLLITWYRDLAAWQASRNARREPRSWEIFQKRHRMTLETLAIATRLWIVEPET